MVETPKREGSTLVSRNVVVNGRRTSLRLEPEMWEGLDEIAQRERLSVNDLVAFVDRQRDAASLTSDVRVFVLGYFRAAATERGHMSAGHGILYRRGLGESGAETPPSGGPGTLSRHDGNGGPYEARPRVL
jgi:predicted DNA-binding ribbon-helix-helix protein